MDAGKIYNSWPLMGESYFPDDNVIANLFNLSVFNEPSLMQFVHRNLAYLIFFFYLLILFNVYKNKLSIFLKPTKLIGLLLFLQIVLGILTLLSGAQMIYCIYAPNKFNFFSQFKYLFSIPKLLF